MWIYILVTLFCVSSRKLWKQLDVNGNGLVSFEEICKALCDDLGLREVARPVISRAFECARTLNRTNTKAGRQLGAIDKTELKPLLKLLLKYLELWTMFGLVDSSGDSFIEYPEFSQAVPAIGKWGLQIVNARRAFEDVDLDGRGAVSSISFVSFHIAS